VNTGRASFAHNDGTPEEAAYAQVTPNRFRVLGARVVLGRDFIDGDRLPQPVNGGWRSAPPDQHLFTYAIASQEYLQRRLGGNPAMLGQPVVRNGPILVGALERGVELLFHPGDNIEHRLDLW